MTSGNPKSVLLVWNLPTRNRGQPWFATGLTQLSVGQDQEESPRKTVNRLRQRDTFRFMGYPITPWVWWSTKLATLVTMRATSHPSRASAGHISGEITYFLLMFWALYMSGLLNIKVASKVVFLHVSPHLDHSSWRLNFKQLNRWEIQTNFAITVTLTTHTDSHSKRAVSFDEIT